MSTDKRAAKQKRVITIDYSNTTLGKIQFEAEVLLSHQDLDGSKIIVLKTDGLHNPNLEVLELNKN